MRMYCSRRRKPIALRSPCCAQAQCVHPWTPVRCMRLTPGACGKNFQRSRYPASRRKPVVWLSFQTKPRATHALRPVFHAAPNTYAFRPRTTFSTLADSARAHDFCPGLVLLARGPS